MTTLLTITRYPKYMGLFGFLSMAIFRLPLWMNKKISFWKLMGCGKNGTFDIHPDWRQWAMIAVSHEPSAISSQLSAKNKKQETRNKELYGSFITAWLKFFRCEILTYLLEPIEGHGKWDGKEVFGPLPKQTDYDGIIAVLTRATIRLSRVKSFWKNVSPVVAQMAVAPGFISSIGIGEMPFIKQATFSIWESKDHVKQFAYGMQQHKNVVQKTRQEKWYSEDMFVRFRVIDTVGSIKGMRKY